MNTDELLALAHSVAYLGCSAEEAGEAFKQLANRMKQLSANAPIDYIKNQTDELRSVPDEKTETPNQKDDLEIFARIVPSEEFLKLEDNMFLD